MFVREKVGESMWHMHTMNSRVTVKISDVVQHVTMQEKMEIGERKNKLKEVVSVFGMPLTSTTAWVS